MHRASLSVGEWHATDTRHAPLPTPGGGMLLRRTTYLVYVLPAPGYVSAQVFRKFSTQQSFGKERGSKQFCFRAVTTSYDG